MTQEFYRKNLRLIEVESILSSIGVGFAVSIMTVFWNSVGMDQTDIGLAQMLFTISMLLFDYPLGYIADRFNRKVLNILGDFGTAFSFLLYATAQNMGMVVLSECLLGFFMAMTNGVDQAFIKHNAEKIDPSGELFKKLNIKVEVARYLALFTTTALGGLIAKYSIRLAISASFIPYFVSGILALFIHDSNIKMKKKSDNFFHDMLLSMKSILSRKKTRVLLLSSVSSNEVTHVQIWVFTPLLLLVGVPIEIVSLGWVLNFLMQTMGGSVAKKMIHLKVSTMYNIPMLIEFAWMIVLIFRVDVITVWLFALNGFVHGMVQANMRTVLQESVDDEAQTSIMSISSTFGRILYMVLVYIGNYFGNIKLTYCLIVVCVVFIPLYLVNLVSLKKIERQ